MCISVSQFDNGQVGDEVIITEVRGADSRILHRARDNVLAEALKRIRARNLGGNQARVRVYFLL